MHKPATPLPWYFSGLISSAALDDAILGVIRDRRYSAPDDYQLAADTRDHLRAVESDIDALLRELGEDA